MHPSGSGVYRLPGRPGGQTPLRQQGIHFGRELYSRGTRHARRARRDRGADLRDHRRHGAARRPGHHRFVRRGSRTARPLPDVLRRSDGAAASFGRGILRLLAGFGRHPDGTGRERAACLYVQKARQTAYRKQGALRASDDDRFGRRHGGPGRSISSS